ncbi:MAG TPA: NAD(P)(+) transhydrogenase (Re/Si-specific) subunit alpha, partial [Gammaproteobacteria bacterium]|nr:NAD(P)(+) transhydrogenase (Re/Si-specific) subunit alpha [Gammaproteobacteria bacterium]
KNLFNLISPFIKDGELVLDWEDEIIRKSALTHGGEIKSELCRRPLEEKR